MNSMYDPNLELPHLLWPGDIREVRRQEEEPVGMRLDAYGLADLLLEQYSIVEPGQPLLVALDGRCASGKTSLAAALAAYLPAVTVFHLDDYFLPPERRTVPRLSYPGGNVDAERFEQEILLPIREGREVVTRSYNCMSNQLEEPVNHEIGGVVICEGSYSAMLMIADYYDVAVFCDIPAEKQRERILTREGSEGWRQFEHNWIPLEEYYIRWTQLRRRCPWYLNAQDEPWFTEHPDDQPG